MGHVSVGRLLMAFRFWMCPSASAEVALAGAIEAIVKPACGVDRGETSKSVENIASALGGLTGVERRLLGIARA